MQIQNGASVSEEFANLIKALKDKVDWSNHHIVNI